MIPRSELEPIKGFDLSRVVSPSREWIDYPTWLGIQRDYFPELHAEADWERVAELLPEEREALALVDAAAQTAEEFDAVAFDEYEAEGGLYGLLELGVTSLVYALNAAGCVSASSCRGHPGKGSEGPWVLFAGSQERVALVNELAIRAGPRLDNMDGGGVALLAPSVVETMALAEAMKGAAASFEPMPSTLDGP
jgi:hypothetical protein